ncbi:DMT family transporter [Lentilactobacillus sp. Marseille-Q4993]|uniref:DMT family transporter n=1 Tax=Lentilactobacillus sp. Marseille-Q4993 TaxID=3039492 RepID=UPI0024BD1C1B|nr:DMT family transporter [Lentilactobacillus sp. Marseille-Q4993]
MENKLVQKHVGKGIALALLASTFWGVSGTVLQIISQGQNIPADWYLSTRTFFAGLVLIIIAAFKYKMRIFDVFKSWHSLGWLLAYAIFGLMANLYTFYFAVQTGTATAATILQYLSPLFIVVGGFLFKREIPLRSDLIAFLLALLGVFLAITHGNIHSLAIPMNALIWGILSGITAAFYVVLPKPVTRDHSPVVVLGWALIIGSLLFNIHHPFWVDVPPIHVSTVAALSTVILLGTILPFLLLLHSLDYAPSAVVSILDAVQPVATFILSLLFLHLEFNVVELIGSFIVVLAIIILQRRGKA